MHLRAHPLCEDCKKLGLIVPAKEVDHIDGNSSNNDPDNHRSLCKSHHSAKTCRENKGFGRTKS
jgi:5-methylcytosine-specific restriction protein A